MEKKNRKRQLKESERHTALKKIAKRFLKGFNVDEKHIYEDFPLGDHVIDLIAYPNRSITEHRSFSVIAIECGSLHATNCMKCLLKIADMLDFVDILIWMPYSIHYNPFADILGSFAFLKQNESGKTIFSTEDLDLHKTVIRISITEEEKDIQDTGVDDGHIAGLMFCKGHTYRELRQLGQKFLHEVTQ